MSSIKREILKLKIAVLKKNMESIIDSTIGLINSDQHGHNLEISSKVNENRKIIKELADKIEDLEEEIKD